MGTNDNKPIRASTDGPASDLGTVVPVAVKVAAELSGVPYVGPLVGALADLVKEHMARTKDAMRQATEQRLSDFYAEMLSADAKMDEQVARAMVDDKDFHALLRACVADIEAEKVGAYANLARGIASGAVARQWRRHFILCLLDLSADELECLRGAYIARDHKLIPSQGSSMGQESFLKSAQPGTPQAIWMANLIARGFVHDAKLSQAGEAFTKACFAPRDLTPGSLGYRTWSGHNVALISYELDDDSTIGLCTKLQDALREVGVKANILAVTRTNQQQSRLLSTLGVVLVRRRTKGLEENLPHLVEFAKKVPTMLVDVAGQAGGAWDVPFFEHLDSSAMDQASLVAEVLRLIVAKTHALGSRQ